VPPSISDSLSSSDAIVREGANVSLTCHVDGYPKPDIKWKRDDGQQININKTLNGTNIYFTGPFADINIKYASNPRIIGYFAFVHIYEYNIYHKVYLYSTI